MLKTALFFFCLFMASMMSSFSQNKPLKIGVIGLTHDHVHWLFGYRGSDIEIVGIAEPNKELVRRYAKQYGFSVDLAFSSIDEMIEKAKPEAVAAFTSIFDHLDVVRKCAPKGIHVMVEKPLAIDMTHAREMAALARKHSIHLITNYETSWYASNHQVYSMLRENKLGPARKIVVHDGHEGPAEIGVSKEFLSWLTDPQLNGGGAIIDFGCYGANLITWLMDGQRPESVTAITQQIKPDVYPKVDDEATIILTYPGAQGIVQASWNWPFSRKDMEVYGENGYAIAVNSSEIRYRFPGQQNEAIKTEEPKSLLFNNPFSYFAALVGGKIDIDPNDLSSLENNLIVVEILDAAIQSAKTGKTVYLKVSD